MKVESRQLIAAQGRFVQTPFVRHKLRMERLAQVIFFLMAATMLIPLTAIVGFLVWKAWPVLSWQFLTTNPKHLMKEGGLWAPLLGTIYLVVTSLVIAGPVGVLAAVYINEYARDNWFKRVVNLAVINLAGVPSIVMALFGVGAFVLFARIGKSILAASLTLAVMTLPVIIATSREALGAVPMSFREACWNVGATRWQTIRHVVLPNAVGGIMTGFIFEVLRAAGETAPIMFTGAVFYKAIAEGDIFAYHLLDQCMALAMHLFTISTQVPGVRPEMAYGTAVVLLGACMLINAAAIILRAYMRARKKW
jgi:phosphate transport system permease protein